jgi:hypothetical protein
MYSLPSHWVNVCRASPIVNIPYQSGSFVIADEPTSLLSKAEVCIRAYYFCYTLYGFE